MTVTPADSYNPFIPSVAPPPNLTVVGEVIRVAIGFR
jgi:hypothetical protein